MKRALLILTAALLVAGFTGRTYSQTGFNTLIEACTGTWCQWCPCGHQIIHDILQNRPNVLVLEYHGPPNTGSDPFSFFNGNSIISIIGFSSYPTGVIGRRTGIISRSAWNNQVIIQSNGVQPGVSYGLTKTWNSGTRQVNMTAVITALQNLTGNYYVNFVIIESNIVYPQTGNGSCPGGSNYVHHHVVRDMVNGPLGEIVNSGGVWNQGQQYTKNFSATLPAGWVAENCDFAIFVYDSRGTISLDSYVQQTIKGSVTSPLGVENRNEAPVSYSLSQNYPNPFNPTTNITFSLPKDGNMSLKIYDVVGNEVAVYWDGFMKAGIYNAEFDGSKLSSGVYFYRLTAGNFIETKKMILSK